MSEDARSVIKKEVKEMKGLVIKVQPIDNGSVLIKLKPNSNLMKGIKLAEEKLGIAHGVYRWLFDGQVIVEDDTPGDLEMEDGDVIDGQIAQIGGL